MIWEIVRKIWIRNSRYLPTVQSYFDTFIKTHRNYQFTVAKVYYGLYELGITCEQYDEVKDELEAKTGRTFPEINCTELMENGDLRKKTFRNERDYRTYQSTFVKANNRRIIKEKREQVEAHFKKVDARFKEPGQKLIMSFDLEVYEYNNDKVLEIGYVVASLGSADPELTEKCHFIIEENLELKNKDFVPDNREGFRFGESQTLSQEAAVEKFRQAVEKCTFLVAHAAQNDEAYLEKIGLHLSQLQKEIMDTQLIEQHKEFQRIPLNDDRLYLRSLTKLLQSYDVNFKEKDLHNAGCDAYYTMKVFLRQMGHNDTVVNALT